MVGVVDLSLNMLQATDAALAVLILSHAGTWQKPPASYSSTKVVDGMGKCRSAWRYVERTVQVVLRYLFSTLEPIHNFRYFSHRSSVTTEYKELRFNTM